MSVNRRRMPDVGGPNTYQGSPEGSLPGYHHHQGQVMPAGYPGHFAHHQQHAGYTEHRGYGPPAPLPPLPYYQQTSPYYPASPAYSPQYPNNSPMQPPNTPVAPLPTYPLKAHPLQRSPSSHQQQAAANFFARSRGQALQQARLQPLDRVASEDEEEAGTSFRTNFRAVLSKAPPPLPAGLLRRLEGGDGGGVGKVRVILRVAASGSFDEERTRFFGMDKKKRQVTLLDPSVSRGEIAMEDRKVGVAAPKMFAFDGVFTSEDSQEEVSTASLTDIIAAVINGSDGCLFCFGHASLGKTFTMLGSDRSARTVGVLPTAIAWLFKAIKERRQRTGARFSVRVSAVEISPGTEQLRDLLGKYASETDQSPGVYLRQLPTSSALQNLSEVRASSLDKAAFYLDAALAERSQDEAGRGSHLLYTLYVYQYSVDKSGKGGVVGGRSRLHLIDFGGCERTRQQGGGITLSSLGNVILAIFNGQKHLPCRESKVTQVLRECLGSLTCHAAMLAHVSPEPAHYSETLHTVQLASRVHRMRRKRVKTHAGGGGSTSSDEQRRLSKLRSHDSGSGKSGSSDFTSTTDPSSSEMSCDTVVFRGHSDGSGTDGEGVPLAMPRLGRALLGSSESLQSRGSRSGRRSGSKILTNGAISPLGGRTNLSPVPRGSPRSPRLGQLAAIQEQPLGKMPLHGRVPGYRQEPAALQRPPVQPAREVWVDGMGGPSPSPAAPRPYGYMDDFKANMISHWVEHQSTREEGQPLYLTQFKQADSDSGSEKLVAAGDTKAIVHSDSTLERLEQPLETNLDDFPESPKISDTAEAHLKALEAAMVAPMECPDFYSELLEAEVKRSQRQPPPPPPPRTTPPRELEEMLSPRGEVEGSESPEPLKEPNSLDNIFLQCEQLVQENINKAQKTETDSHRHPLRILSEENLTIVSTFVADVNDLESMEDDEECDPSKFSFFEVPEFTSRNNCPDDQYFETRLRELVKMTCPPPDKGEGLVDKAKEDAVDDDAVKLDKAVGPSNKSFSDPRFLREGSSQTLSTFGQTDRGPLSDSCQMDQQSPESRPDNSQMMLMLDRSPVDCQMESPSPLPSPPDDEPLTPQKQFLLLSHTLRHPDGSSNPDLNLATTAISDMKRSPGNGQSSSDQEDEIRLNLTTYTDAVNGNQNEPCNRSVGSSEQLQVSEAKPKKKESNNIAARLLRLFGSTRKKNASKIEERRSKSCDRQLEEAALPKNKEVLQKDFRSASSSPMKRTEKNNKKSKTGKEGKGGKGKGREREDCMMEGRETPSTLSLAPTEWEFQNGTEEEDERNGNAKTEVGNGGSLRPKYDQRYNLQPSAGRHAFLPASSLQELSLQRDDRKSSGYDSLEGESSSLDSSNDNNELLNGNVHHNTPTAIEYAVPSDQKEALQYDEVNQLKMEIKRHPNILRREY